MATAGPRPIDAIFTGIFFRSPTFTRLEPQSVTGDPTPGIAAPVHDPLWAMFRQWQVGEYCGEDAGTPLAVTIGTTIEPISLFNGGAPGTGAIAGDAMLRRGALDRQIEREPPPPAGPGSRARAEAGAALTAGLIEAGLAIGTGLADRYPFAADAVGPNEPRLIATMIAAAADGEAIAAALEAGTPDWLAPAGDAAKAAASAWLGWYRANVSPKGANACWDRSRLEYHFTIATDAGASQRVFTAPAHLGGDVDWYALDALPGRTVSGGASRPVLPFPLPRDPAPPGPVVFGRGPADPTTLVAPLRFAGMPADRFWEFEDGRVSFGATAVQTNDVARLCLIEFATVYGCDWFLAPVEIPASGFTTVRRLSVIDSFGVRTEIKRADDGRDGARFRLFEQTIVGQAEAMPGLLTVGGARGAIEGPPVESVIFLRDESANMAWAVEDKVQAPSGAARSRRDEIRPIVPLPDAVAGTDLRYTLETDVPRHWIPFVPVAKPGNSGGFVLRKGTVTDKDEALGRILAGDPGKAVDLFDEEVPRSGVRVSRMPTLARDGDGRPVRWVAMRVGEGVGEVDSGLASDQTGPTGG